MKTLLLNIYRGRYILKTMVMKDIKARYAGSVFGPVWLIVTPLYQILLYTFLFSIILRVRFEEGAGTFSFVIYLLAGIIPWIFFSEATARGVSTFIENAHLIKKVKFPIEICVASVIVSSAITFLIYLILYVTMLLINGIFKPYTFFLFLIPFIIEVILILGVCLGLGSLAVFFRDVTQGIGMVLNLVFFLTPIVYPASTIPEKVRWVFSINPFYFIVEIYRDVLIRGKVPDPYLLIYPSVFSVVFFLSGYFLFSKTKEAFKDIL